MRFAGSTAFLFLKEDKPFESRSEVKVWMLSNQLGRRNINDFQRGEMSLMLENVEREEAVRRMHAGKADDIPIDKLRQDQEAKDDGDPGVKLRQGQKQKGDRSGRTMSRLGKRAGISETTMRKVAKIVNEADEETKEQLRRGEMKIHTAYVQLPSVARPGEKKACSRCHREKPLTDFSLRSNRQSYSTMCKDCEREVEEAARSAAKVASETTEPVGTYPVQGMAMFKGHPIHIGSAPEDKPEMFTQVKSLLDFAVHGYLADVQVAMKWFGPNMRTPENVKLVEDMIYTTCKSAMALLHENDQDDEQKED